MTAVGLDLLPALLDEVGVGVAVFDAEGRFHYVNEHMATMNGVPARAHVGRTIAEVLPELEPVLTPLVAHTARTGERAIAVDVQGNTPAASGRRWQASYVPLSSGGEQLVGVVVQDVTRREAAVAETRRRLAQQVALADLGQRALAATPLDEVLATATDVLRRELQATLAGILTPDPVRGDLVMRAGSGFPHGVVGAMRAAPGAGSMAGYALQTGVSVVTRDSLCEERFTFSASLLEEGVRSAITVPIPGPDGHFGVVGVLSHEVDHFDEDDDAFVRALANVLGAAVVRTAQELELAQLAALRESLVAQTLDAGERERREVADLLQDEALQHLLLARLELSSSGGADPQARARAAASIDAATGLLRRVVGGLHSVTLEHAGLAAAVDGLAAEHAERGLHVDVDVAPASQGAHDHLLFGLVRELLANVAAHAGASRAQVALQVRGDAVELCVSDDGRGIGKGVLDTALAHGDIGLASARARVAALDGSLDVGPGIGGRGTAVTVRLPA